MIFVSEKLSHYFCLDEIASPRIHVFPRLAFRRRKVPDPQTCLFSRIRKCIERLSLKNTPMLLSQPRVKSCVFNLVEVLVFALRLLDNSSKSLLTTIQITAVDFIKLLALKAEP